MASPHGAGMALRKEIIPDWLKRGGRHLGVSSTPSAPFVPVIDPREMGDPSPLPVTLSKPTLELRTAEDIEQLRAHLRQLRKHTPGLFPSDPLDLPDPLPEGWTIEDVLGSVAPAEADQATHKDYINVLAFYVSPRNADYRLKPWEDSDHASTWGVYLHASGVETLARAVYLPVGYGHREALGFAAADLLNHELQHAAYDLSAITLEAGEGPRAQLGQHHLVHSVCDLEEALCHASMIRTARARDLGPGTRENAAVRRLEQWATSGPAGYRNWRTHSSDSAHVSGGREVIQHDGLDPRLARAMLDYTSTTAPLWLPDIPVWLILDPGTEAAAGSWSF